MLSCALREDGPVAAPILLVGNYIKYVVFTRVASEAKRAERNEVERVCGGEGGVPSASWSLCLFVATLYLELY